MGHEGRVPRQWGGAAVCMYVLFSWLKNGQCLRPASSTVSHLGRTFPKCPIRVGLPGTIPLCLRARCRRSCPRRRGRCARRQPAATPGQMGAGSGALPGTVGRQVCRQRWNSAPWVQAPAPPLVGRTQQWRGGGRGQLPPIDSQPQPKGATPTYQTHPLTASACPAAAPCDSPAPPFPRAFPLPLPFSAGAGPCPS